MADVTAPETERWLEPYIEIDDEDLRPAKRRFARVQVRVLRELQRQGIPVISRHHSGSILTTALEADDKRPEKGGT